MELQRTNPGIAAGIGVNYKARGKDASRAAELNAQERALARRGAALDGLVSAVGNLGESVKKSAFIVGNANVDSHIVEARIQHNEQERQKKALEEMQRADAANLKTDTGLTMKQIGAAYDALSSEMSSNYGKYESEEQFSADFENKKAAADNAVYEDVAKPRDGGVNFRNWKLHEKEVKRAIEQTMGNKFRENELAKFRAFKTKESIGKVNTLLEGMSSSGKVYSLLNYEIAADALIPILGEKAAKDAARIHYTKGILNAATTSYESACESSIQIGLQHFDALVAQGANVDYARDVGITRAREHLSQFVPDFGDNNEGELQNARRTLEGENFFGKLDSKITSRFKGFSETTPGNMIDDFRNAFSRNAEPIYAQTREFVNLFSQEGGGKEGESYYFGATQETVFGQRELFAIAEADVWQADVTTSQGQKEILKTLRSAQPVLSEEQYSKLCNAVKQKFANAGRESPEKNSVKERLMEMMGIKKWSEASPEQKQFIETTVKASQKNTLGLTTDEFLKRQHDNYKQSVALSRSTNEIVANIYFKDLSGAADTFSELFGSDELMKGESQASAGTEDAASVPASIAGTKKPDYYEKIVTSFGGSGVSLNEQEQKEVVELARKKADEFRVGKHKIITLEDGRPYEFFANEDEVQEYFENRLREISIGMLHDKQKVLNEENARREAEAAAKRLQEEESLKKEYEALRKEGYVPSPFAFLPSWLGGSVKKHVEFMRRQKAAKEERKRKEDAEIEEKRRKVEEAKERLKNGK